MTPYFYLLLAASSLGILGIMHKVADQHRCRPEAVNLFLFLGATLAMSVISVRRFGAGAALNVPAIAWITAAGCGFLASFAILNFQRGIRYGKISTSWLVINLSTILPTLLSIVIYHESVSARRALGLLLSVAALSLLWMERRSEERLAAAL